MTWWTSASRAGTPSSSRRGSSTRCERCWRVREGSQALGYRELAAHLAGELAHDDAVALAVARTRRFARRQERWFRRDPRITWLDPPPDDPGPEHVLDDLLAVLDAASPTAPGASRA